MEIPEVIKELESKGYKYDSSLRRINKEAYDGAIVWFNALGLNRMPFDNEDHRRAYMALSAMEEMLQRPVSLSPKIPNDRLFGMVHSEFVKAVEAYKKSC